MKMICFFAGAFLLSCSAVLAQDGVWSEVKLFYNVLNPEVRMTEAQIKPGKMMPDLSLLKKIEPHLKDPDENTRLYVYNTLHSLMQNAQNAYSRRELIRMIVNGIGDPAESIRSASTKWLLTFPSGDFDEDAKTSIREFFRARGQYPTTQAYVILLIGHAGMQDMISSLKPLAVIEDPDSQYIKNAALLAMARMGDTTAMSAFLRYFQAKKDTGLIVDLLRDLAYTKQPKAVDILVDYLNAGDADELLTNDASLAPYAAWFLSDILKDFPVSLVEPKLSPDDLRMCRQWVKDHYDSWNLEELLGGEVQRWR